MVIFWEAFVSICVGAPALSRRCVLGPALSAAGPRPLSVLRSARHPSCSASPTHPAPRPCPGLPRPPAPTGVPPIRPRRPHTSDHPVCGPPAGIRVPPSSPGPSSNPRAIHPARRVPFYQERTPNLAVWGKIHGLRPAEQCVHLVVCFKQELW